MFSVSPYLLPSFQYKLQIVCCDYMFTININRMAAKLKYTSVSMIPVWYQKYQKQHSFYFVIEKLMEAVMKRYLQLATVARVLHLLSNCRTANQLWQCSLNWEKFKLLIINILQRITLLLNTQKHVLYTTRKEHR